MKGRTVPGTRSLRRWGLLALVPVVLVLGAWAFQQKTTPADTPADAPPAGPVPTLPVTTARLRPWAQVVRVQGSLLGYEQAVVGTRVEGLVKDMKVDIGSAVRKGDILAVVDTRELDLKVELARAHLLQARAKLGLKPDDPAENLDRTKTPAVRQERAMMDTARARARRVRALSLRQTISPEEVELEEANAEVAEARYQSALNTADEWIAQLAVFSRELELAEQAVKDARIQAPFDGVVLQRQAAPGVFLHRGDTVVTLVRTDPLRFHAAVPESAALQVREGQTVRLEIEGLHDVLETKVRRISPALDMASRSLVVEADLPNPRGALRAGLFTEARIVIDADARALSVPAGAVHEFAGVEKVWVVFNGEAHEQPVRTGRRTRDAIEILDGLHDGDQVAIDARQARPGRVAAIPAQSIIRGAAD
jgi:membrane fusion protein, multidrug efflux system